MHPTTISGTPRPVLYRSALPLQARQPEPSHRRETRTRVIRGLVACAAFLALVTGGWLIGTRPPTTPDGTATKPPADRTEGRIVYELPDGRSCRYVAFDNVTQWVGEPNTTICDDVARKERRPPVGAFSWGR